MHLRIEPVEIATGHYKRGARLLWKCSCCHLALKTAVRNTWTPSELGGWSNRNTIQNIHALSRGFSRSGMSWLSLRVNSTEHDCKARLSLGWLLGWAAVCDRKIGEAEERARKEAIAAHSEALETGLQENTGSGFNLNTKWEQPGTVKRENALCFISQVFRETAFYSSSWRKGITAKIPVLSSDYNLTARGLWTLAGCVRQNDAMPALMSACYASLWKLLLYYAAWAPCFSPRQQT